jgi:hypothetical protein
MMNCLECQNLLQQRLDGATTLLAPDLDSHLAQCSSCRQLHLSGNVLLKGLKALPAPMAPMDFTKRLAAAVMKDRQLRRGRRRVRLVITAALAACLLIMTFAGYALLPVHRDTDFHPEIVAKKDSQENVRKATTPPRLTQSVDEARQAFASLSERWAENAQKQTKLLLAATPLPMSEIDVLPAGSAALELEPAAKSLQQAGQGVADTLQPVAQTARRAVAYFVRDLPVFEKSVVAN